MATSQKQSIVASHPVAGGVLYASTKGAIETLTTGMMDWTTLTWIGVLVVLAFVMLRGCGGMAGGCGMGSRHTDGDNEDQRQRDSGRSGTGRAA